jgi:hypothetical protein
VCASHRVGGWGLSSRAEWVDGRMGGCRNGWMGGFAKVDNRFGYEKWLQVGSIGLDLL